MTDLTDTTLSALRAKAEAANKPAPPPGSPLAEHTWAMALHDFRSECDPAIILEVCKALEEAWETIRAAGVELEVVRAENKRLASANTDQYIDITTLETELATLRAENERLRAERECYIKRRRPIHPKTNFGDS